MNTSIYPHGTGQWVALITALAPFVMWAVSGLLRGFVMLSRHREDQWKRLHELALILYNKDGQSGNWGQILAAKELQRLHTRKNEAKKLASLAADHFSASGSQEPGMKELIATLRESEAR